MCLFFTLHELLWSRDRLTLMHFSCEYNVCHIQMLHNTDDLAAIPGVIITLHTHSCSKNPCNNHCEVMETLQDCSGAIKCFNYDWQSKTKHRRSMFVTLYLSWMFWRSRMYRSTLFWWTEGPFISLKRTSKLTDFLQDAVVFVAFDWCVTFQMWPLHAMQKHDCVPNVISVPRRPAFSWLHTHTLLVKGQWVN